MPLRLDVKKQLIQRTDRVKGVDLHPTEPWLLANLYNGNVYLWNHSDQTLVKSFEVTELPVRSAKFIARKQWIAVGSDDMYIRIYNYNTSDKVKTFEAHTDYIRSLAVHPTQPYLLSSSDDMLIKLWDWDKGWSCTQVFEGHSHYVMQVCFNPKDPNTFASASLDRTIKVWSVGQPTANFTLEGHEKGVNCVDYFTGGDRPYLISGADDKLVKVWDYQTKACVQTLEGHTHNVAAVCFHPELPIIVTGSEDGTVRIWHANTYRLENTLNYGMERVWTLGAIKGSNNLAIGYDEGAVVVKIGRDEPVASMDASGKIIWARHNEIQTVNVKALGADYQTTDGERLPLAVKDLGSCDLYPQSLKHNPNGRFVSVCGDGEFIVYTALAWRNKSFGSAREFVWSADSNEYATRDASSKVAISRNFQEKATVKVDFAVEALHGGALLGCRTNDFVCFYDWSDGRLVRRIDAPVRDIIWSENGELVAIIAETSFYILRYMREAVEAAIASGVAPDSDGYEDAFDLVHEEGDAVRTGLWVGDCFIYNNAAWRLNYCVGKEVTTLYHLDRPMYLLGYLAAQNRVYLIDREFGIVCYTVLLSTIEFKTLVMRGDFDQALAILPTIPPEQHTQIARFLEGRGYVKEALDIATDPDYKFDLAIQLGDLDTALDIAETLDTESRWKQLGELALSQGQLPTAEACLHKANDLAGLLLLYSAQGNRAGLAKLASNAGTAGKHNVGFLSLFLLGDVDACMALLLETGRLPEAAFFARTYLPSRISEVCKVWKEDLRTLNPRAAEALADPAEYPNMFPDLQLALQAEQLSRAQRSRGAPPALAYSQFEGATLSNLLERVAGMSLDEREAAAAAVAPGARDGGGGAAGTGLGLSNGSTAGAAPAAATGDLLGLDDDDDDDDSHGAPPPPRAAVPAARQPSYGLSNGAPAAGVPVAAPQQPPPPRQPSPNPLHQAPPATAAAAPPQQPPAPQQQQRQPPFAAATAAGPPAQPITPPPQRTQLAPPTPLTAATRPPFPATAAAATAGALPAAFQLQPRGPFDVQEADGDVDLTEDFDPEGELDDDWGLDEDDDKA